MGRILQHQPSRYYALASKFYPPITKRDVTSKYPINSSSQRAMLENGLIDHAGAAGLFYLLPMALRSLEKLNRLICREMDSIGAQKLQMPTLCDRKFWDRTGRWTRFGGDLFRIKDRLDEEYCLAPTHEESITHLVACRLSELHSTTTPLLLYQTTTKFRDEMKPRHGLLRSREFLMKDLYSFDVDEKQAERTYRLLTEAYDRIFDDRLTPVRRSAMRVLSDVGPMGGSLSHEYHFENECGQDRIDYCRNCRSGVNRELIKKGNSEDDDGGPPSKCPECSTEMKTFRSIEIAHTFLLGTKYAQDFDVYFTINNGKQPAFMGCFGIGVTRLLAALIDCNLTRQNQIRWPTAIAPYKLCLIPPKDGSKEDRAGATRFSNDVLNSLIDLENLKDEIIYDDRIQMTVGRRLMDAKRLGIPFIVVANKSIVQESIPRFEFFDLTKEDAEEEMQLVTHEELFARMRSLN